MIRRQRLNYIDFYTICGPKPGPHLLIIAGIHGDEFEPMVAAIQLLNSVEKKLRCGKITILPVANILAYEPGHRCGADQKDLARILPGKESGSDIEIIAHEVTYLIKQADYLIDLHTGGSEFDILPLTGYMLHPDKKTLAKQREMARAFNLPIIWGTDARADGRTLSVARDFNIPAIYAECRGGVTINTETIKLYEKGCLNVMHYLGLTNLKSKKTNVVRTWVDDNRRGQGHLQKKLPAPKSGIFIPSVVLGKKIKKGSVLGHIINPIQNKKKVVIVKEGGILFMLRISARVKVGESLGGILPVAPKSKKIIHAK